jgi:hypothetical protein
MLSSWKEPIEIFQTLNQPKSWMIGATATSSTKAIGSVVDIDILTVHL